MFSRENLSEDKHFSFDDLALKRYIFDDERRYSDHLRKVSDDYRMMLEMPGAKDREVNLTLYNNRIMIRQRVKHQRVTEDETSDLSTIIFAARVDTLQRIALSQSQESGDEHSLVLHLSFYWEQKDCYRDICLKKPKDGKEPSHHRRKMSELVSSILVLREEIVCDYLPSVHMHGTRDKIDDYAMLQISTTILNKLQVLPLPGKPHPLGAVMGCLPKSENYDPSNELSEVTVDADFEQSRFSELVNLLEKIDQQKSTLRTDQISEQVALEQSESQVKKVLSSICENCNYYSLRPAEETHVRDFVIKLTKLIDDYEKQEAGFATYGSIANQQADFHESELDTASEDDSKPTNSETQQSRGKAERIMVTELNESHDSGDERDLATSRRDDSESYSMIKNSDLPRVSFEQLNETTERLARMLLVFQKMMQSNQVYSSQFQLGSNSQQHCQALTKRLFKLMKVDNFLITYQASQAVISIMQFVCDSESSDQGRNRGQLLRQIDFMKYLGRHLSFHDRFIKMQGRVYCDLSLKIIADLLRAFFGNRKAPRLILNASYCLTEQDYEGRRNRVLRGTAMPLIEGGGACMSIQAADMQIFLQKLQADDNKLLHVIERFSLLDSLVAKVSFGRIVADLLSFCNSDRGQQMVLRPQDGHIFGYMQYRLFAYSISLLVQVETLMLGSPQVQAQNQHSLDDKAKVKSQGSGALNSTFTNALRTLGLLMKDNSKAAHVFTKLFKKYLFNLVPSYDKDCTRWGDCEWYNFFIVVRKETLEGPKNFWNDQSRADCLRGLRLAIKGFNQEVQDHIKPILRQDSDLTHLTHYYSPSGQLLTTQKHLKWNFEEFRVSFSGDKCEIKVWRYYLNKLVIEKDDQQSVPSLHKDFDRKEAKELWDHLLEVFVPARTNRDNLKKRQLILKCLILLYRNFPQKIGPMNMMPYWLRLLEDKNEKDCHFLTLQLILVALDAPPKTREAYQNAKIFEDAGGLSKIIGCLNYGYLDLHQTLIFKKAEKLTVALEENDSPVKHRRDQNFILPGTNRNGFTQSFNMSNMDEVSEIQSQALLEDPTADFNSVVQHTKDMAESESQIQPDGEAGDVTDLKDLIDADDYQSNQSRPNIVEDPPLNVSVGDVKELNRELQELQVNYTKTIKSRSIFKDNTRNVNIAILALTIIDFSMSLPKNRDDDPLSKSKSFLLRPENVAIIVQLLLLENTNLIRCILKFVYTHFKSQIALDAIKNSGIVEFLILLLDNTETTSFDEIFNLDEPVSGSGDPEQDMARPTDDLAADDLPSRAKWLRSALLDNRYKEVPKTLAECAFSLIERLTEDEVTPEDLNAIELLDFDTNEKNLLEQVQDLKKSLFLRYLPLNMILVTQESQNTQMRPDHEFLNIFQHDSYETATIIWKKEMRQVLKEAIMKNSSELVRKLHEYFSQSTKQSASIINKTLHVPQYEGTLRKRIKYVQIEDEVKCGKYYLRIWVSQRDRQQQEKGKAAATITIPESEEENYLSNLKDSMEGIFESIRRIGFERFIHYQDLTYTLKACLYAGETFKRIKSFVCQDPVVNLIKQLMEHFKGKQQSQSINHELQQILMLALNIINTFIIAPEHSKGGTGEHRLNLDTILRRDGQRDESRENEIIQLHEQIIRLIYNLASKRSRDKSSTVLAQFEVSILKFAIQNLDAIMQHLKTQRYARHFDKTEHRRLKLSINLTEILSLSDDLYLIVDQHAQIEAKQRKTSGSPRSSKLSPKRRFAHEREITARQEQPVRPQVDSINVKEMYRDKDGRVQNLHKYGLAYKNVPQIKKQITHTRQKSSALAQTTRHSSSSKFLFISQHLGVATPQIKDDLQVHQTKQELIQQLHSNQKSSSLAAENQFVIFEPADVEKAFNRYRKGDVQQQDEKKQVTISSEEKFQSVIQLTASIFKLGLYLAHDSDFMPDLIRSGFVWRALRFLQFSMQRDMLYYFEEVDHTLDNCCLILFHAVSKATEKMEDLNLVDDATLSHVSSTVTEPGSKIWPKFIFAMNQLLPRKILETLKVPRLRLGDKRLDLAEYEKRNHAIKFRKLFQLETEATPELIWDSEMRENLRSVLYHQLQGMLSKAQYPEAFIEDPDMFLHQVRDFEFASEREALKIEGVFVQHFNKDIFFRPSNMVNFVMALIQRLHSETAGGEFTNHLTQESVKNTYEIVKALQNLIQYQNALHTAAFKSAQHEEGEGSSEHNEQTDDNIKLLCEIVRSHQSDNWNKDIAEKVLEIKEVVIETLVLIAQDKELAPSLLGNLHFALLVAYAFDSEPIAKSAHYQHSLVQSLAQILSEIWEFQNRLNEPEFIEDFNKLLNHDGILLFMLKVILSRRHSDEARRTLTLLLHRNMLIDGQTMRKLSAWFPTQFFNMRAGPLTQSDSEKDEEKRADLFAKRVLQDSYESHFVVWTRSKHENVYLSISRKCTELLQQLDAMKGIGQGAFQRNHFPLQEVPSEELVETMRKNMEHEVVVKDIILRNFNKDPSVYIQQEFGSFVGALASTLNKQANNLDFLCKKSQASEAVFVLDASQGPVSEESLKRMLSYVAAQATVVTTSLVFCIEQVCYNGNNPNFKDRVQKLEKELREMQAASKGKQSKARLQSGSILKQQVDIDELFQRKKIEILPEADLIDLVLRLIDLLMQHRDLMPVELRLSLLQLVRYVHFISEGDQLAGNDTFIAFLRKLVITIGDDSDMPTIECIIGYDLIASVIEQGKSRSKLMTERIFESSQLELQKLKKVCMQANLPWSENKNSLDKASTHLMTVLAKNNPEICRDFTEEFKSVSGEESQKWAQILDIAIQEGGGTGVECRGSPPSGAQRMFYKKSAKELGTDFIDDKVSGDIAIGVVTLPLVAREAVECQPETHESIESELPLIALIDSQMHI